MGRLEVYPAIKIFFYPTNYHSSDQLSSLIKIVVMSESLSILHLFAHFHQLDVLERVRVYCEGKRTVEKVACGSEVISLDLRFVVFLAEVEREDVGRGGSGQAKVAGFVSNC